MIKPKRKTFKVEDLNPAKYNPRTISDDAKAGLKKSIDQFGYIQDIIVNIRDDKNIIVGGHQRLTAMELKPTDEIECTIVDLDEKDEKALNIALNSRHIAGDWDLGKLDDLLQEISDHDFFADLGLDKLADEYGFNDKVEIKEDNSEPKIGLQTNECPKCGYKW